MLYLDACVLVTATTPETATARVQRWLSGARDLALSDWGLTEVASALSLKVRTGELSLQDRGEAAKAVAALVSGIQVVAVERSHFAAAARLAANPGPGLRAGDALHLAICMDRGDTLVTLDKGLVRAARGVQAVAIEL